jgi:hypothetical protein
VLDCSRTASFTKSFIYLGSVLHCDLSDDHDADAYIKKASKAFRVPRGCFFSFSLVAKQLKYCPGFMQAVTTAACFCTASSRGA